MNTMNQFESSPKPPQGKKSWVVTAALLTAGIIIGFVIASSPHKGFIITNDEWYRTDTKIMSEMYRPLQIVTHLYMDLLKPLNNKKIINF